jgi:hypothetical protein
VSIARKVATYAVICALVLSACRQGVILPSQAPIMQTADLKACMDQLADDECEALAELLNEPLAAPCDDTEHISCENGHVTRADFRWAHAFGYQITAVPSSIGLLTHLRELRLTGNYSMSGTIPLPLTTLTGLTILDMGDAHLTGSIPAELGKLTNLTYLNLDANDLTGSIPPELGHLTKLTYLHLYGNRLTGTIPPELGAAAYLQEIHLGHNSLTGSLPPALFTLTNLQRLYLHDNQLSGAIPPEIGNLVNLEDLYLRQNDFSGQLPPELGHLAHLRRLDVSLNHFEGRLPESLGTIKPLQQLWFHEAGLSESAPSGWLQTIPMTSAVSRYEEFHCSYVTTIPRGECDTLVAVFLALNPNGVYYSRRPDSWSDRYGAAMDNPHIIAFDSQNSVFPAFVAANPCVWFTVDCKDGHLSNVSLIVSPANTPYRLPEAIMQFPKSVVIWTQYSAELCYPQTPEFKAWMQAHLASYDPIEPCQP